MAVDCGDSRLLNRYDDLSNLLIRLHVAVRFHDLRKWKDAVYTRFEGARLDMVENIALRLCLQLRDGKYFAKRISTDGEPFAQRGKQGKRCWLGGKCSVLEDCSTRSRSLSQQLDAFAPNGVKDYASTFAARNLLYSRDEVLFFGRNHVCCSDFY